jgi:dipeptidase
MCDIVVATPKATKDHVMIFAKNSDRDPNEAQIIEYIPRLKHEEGYVRTTYIEFPQVRETYAILISRPWWIWGAEMGVNEFGLAIGNTAVFTRERVPMKGLLGMDIIRLALERMSNAKDALNFIIRVIEEYGQGGNASYEHKMLYSNSFVIADPEEAWVLETAGKYWVAKRVDTTYSISNALTIENDWDLASDDVIRLSRRRGFGFARYFSDKLYTYFAHGRDRREFTYNALRSKEGYITPEYIMSILRSHFTGVYYPWRGSMKDVCMHYGGFLRPTQTASSQVSILRRNGLSIHWFTGTSLPCLSMFKPLYVSDEFGELLRQVMGEQPTNKYNPSNYWWFAEYVHRKLVLSYGSEVMIKYVEELRGIENNIMREIEDARGISDLLDISRRAFMEERQLLQRLFDTTIPRKAPITYIRLIMNINKHAELSM